MWCNRGTGCQERTNILFCFFYVEVMKKYYSGFEFKFYLAKQQ